MRKLFLFFVYFTVFTFVMSATSGQFWGSWYLSAGKKNMRIKVLETDKVELYINGIKHEKISYEYFRPSNGTFEHLSITWKGDFYGEYCLDLMPLNQDEEIEREFLIGIFQIKELIDDEKEIDKIVNIPVKFINEKRIKNAKPIQWNNVRNLRLE